MGTWNKDCLLFRAKTDRYLNGENIKLIKAGMTCNQYAQPDSTSILECLNAKRFLDWTWVTDK